MRREEWFYDEETWIIRPKKKKEPLKENGGCVSLIVTFVVVALTMTVLVAVAGGAESASFADATESSKATEDASNPKPASQELTLTEFLAWHFWLVYAMAGIGFYFGGFAKWQTGGKTVYFLIFPVEPSSRCRTGSSTRSFLTRANNGTPWPSTCLISS